MERMLKKSQKKFIGLDANLLNFTQGLIFVHTFYSKSVGDDIYIDNKPVMKKTLINSYPNGILEILHR